MAFRYYLKIGDKYVKRITFCPMEITELSDDYHDCIYWKSAPDVIAWEYVDCKVIKIKE